MVLPARRRGVARSPRRIGRWTDEWWSPAAGVVPVARSLDLDHPGAEVGQHHRRVRAGQRPGQVDDGDIGQRSAVHGCLQASTQQPLLSPGSA